MGLRGAPRTRIRPAPDGHGFPPGPCGVSTPFGLQPGRTSRPDCSGRGPPCAFASLQRPTAAHPHRPGVPKDPHDERCFLPWAFALLDTYRNGGPAVLAGLPAPRVPRARFGYLLRGVHHRPCGRLAAPEHPRASPFQAFSSRRSAFLSEDPALMTLRTSIRLAPRGSRADGAAFRALIPTSNSFVAPLAGRRVEACLGFTPPELSLLPSSRARCSPRTVPQHALGGIDVPTRLRLGVFRCGRPGIAPLGVAGSPGVSYLSTVAAPLRPPRGTSV